MVGTTSRRGIFIMLLLIVAGTVAPLSAADEPASPRDQLLGPIEAMVQEAKKMGAAKHCPRSYEAAVSALATADAAIAANPEDAAQGAAAAEIEAADIQAHRVKTRIEFIRELRSHKYGWEAAAEQYDQLVASVARNAGFALPAGLSGQGAGRAAADSISARRAASRALIDSLTYLSRDLQQWVDLGKSAQDSVIDRQQTEISDLRHRVWELEIRAGVAEAERDKAKHEVERDQQRRELVRSLGDLFAPDEGRIVLTPEGDVRVVLNGLKFSSGSAWLNPNYDPLLDRLAEVIKRFPNAPITVEGHTDNTGTRATNQSLSRERAKRVAAALAVRTGLAQDVLTVTGVGPDRPIADNDTAAGRARNRRIEVLIAAGKH